MGKDSGEIARGSADVALKLAEHAAPRDALVDPLPSDIIPDNEEKGYHVGEVRQPAEPVLTGAGVHFESVDGGESKFPSYADQVKANDEYQRGRPEYEGVVHVAPETSFDEIARSLGARGGGSGVDRQANITRARRATSSRGSKRGSKVDVSTGSTEG